MILSDHVEAASWGIHEESKVGYFTLGLNWKDLIRTVSSRLLG